MLVRSWEKNHDAVMEIGEMQMIGEWILLFMKRCRQLKSTFLTKLTSTLQITSFA